MASPKPTTPDEILSAALAREEEAHAFYAGLAGDCHFDAVKDVLERLRDEEARHVRLIRELTTKLNLGRNIV
jgi:rubrerythrin